MIYPLTRFLGIAFLLAGFCSLAMAEDQSRPLPKRLLPEKWRLSAYDEPTYRGSRDNRDATRLSWHPDGRHLAYGYDRLQGSGFNELHLLDTKSGKHSIIIKEALDPCFSMPTAQEMDDASLNQVPNLHFCCRGSAWHLSTIYL